MKENKHTKGEWTIVEHSWSDTSLMCGDKTIAFKTIYDDATEENQDELETEVMANFRLLAQASNLLAILRELVEDVQDEPISTAVNDTLRRANEIINKAIGE